MTPLGQPVVFLKSVSVVGGSGLGCGGVEYVTGCDSWLMPPVMFAPASAAVTVPVEQLPTPERGVESDPLIIELFPSERFPLVPTSPLDGDGLFQLPAMLE